MIRLGGFVIHGDNQGTLARCLDSLCAVADTCVAVDTGSKDGSAQLVRERDILRLPRRWEGYGAARAAAVEALQGCDYLFFLDSDEWLEPEAVAALQAWKSSAPRAAHYSLVRRDWAHLGGHPFLYRTERHVRLVRRDAAQWDRRMIVHEALPPAETVRLPVMLEHQFADSVDSMRSKVERYALLWAIRFREDRRPNKPALLQHVAHLLRETLLKGSLFRGGLRAVELADAVAYHHARKYTLLQEVRRGAHADMVEAFEQGRLEDLFRLLKARVPAQGAGPATAPLRPPAPVAARAELAPASLGLRRQD
jgi:glycosyltransferase involved in cell wall biosynthesis